MKSYWSGTGTTEFISHPAQDIKREKVTNTIEVIEYNTAQVAAKRTNLSQQMTNRLS